MTDNVYAGSDGNQRAVDAQIVHDMRASRGKMATARDVWNEEYLPGTHDAWGHGDPEDLEAVSARMRRQNTAARAAGVTSKDYPSLRPIGSVLDDLSARPERAKVLGVQRVRTLLAHAEHFLLDEEAGQRIVKMVEDDSALIGELQPFALRPYERMTISLPTRATEDTEREVLLLLDKYQDLNAFAMVLRNLRGGEIVPIPGWYIAPLAKPGDKSRTVIRLDDSMPPDERMKYAVATYSMAMDAILLLLNQKKGIHISEPSMKRRSLRGGRPVTYFARSTIKLTLGSPMELHHHFAGGTRDPCRRHAVRGHFFHRGGDLTCTHRWARLDGWENGWECVDCERRRFWRRDFERGDIERGIVDVRYSIRGAGA